MDSITTFSKQIKDLKQLTAEEEVRLATRPRLASSDAILCNHNLKLAMKRGKKYAKAASGLSEEDLIQEANIGLMKAVEKYDPTLINPKNGKPYRFSTYAIYWIDQTIKYALSSSDRLIKRPTYLTDLYNKCQTAKKAISLESGQNVDDISDEELAAFLDETPSKIKKALYATQIESIDSLSAGSSIRGSIEGARERGAHEVITDGGGPQHEFSKVVTSPYQEVELTSSRNEIDQTLVNVLSERERFILALRFGLDKEKEHTLREIGDKLKLTTERVRQLESNALKKIRKSKRAKELFNLHSD